MTKKQKIGVLGYGEVGQAMAKFYKKPLICDLDRNEFEKGMDIVHVCIPHSKKFVASVKKVIKDYNAKLVIIHSSVPVGTTKKIGFEFAVHSPIRGVHPNLYKGVKTFPKFIGADSAKAGKLVSDHFKKIGIKGIFVLGSENTEALKLWDTTQYGFMIMLNKAIKKWCNEKGLDFDAVYTLANQTYNEGYRKLGKDEVVRPWLKYMDGRIGGHCVIPNCHLLDSAIAKMIIRFNEDL